MNSDHLDKATEYYQGQRIAYVNRGSDRLIVSLQTFRNGMNFMAGNGLMSKTSSDLLFLTNPNNDYYSDLIYFEILNKYIEKYKIRNVLFFGSSMAGYAALRYAYHFGANFFVNNPQADISLTLKFAWDALRREIEKFSYRGNVFDSATLHSECFGYYCHGQHDLDVANAKFFFEKLSVLNKSFVIRDVVANEQHTFLWKNFSDVVRIIEKIIDLREIENNRRGDGK